MEENSNCRYVNLPLMEVMQCHKCLEETVSTTSQGTVVNNPFRQEQLMFAIGSFLWTVWLLSWTWSLNVWTLACSVNSWKGETNRGMNILTLPSHLCDVRTTEHPSLMMLRIQSHRKRRALGSIPVVGSSCNTKNIQQSRKLISGLF